MLKGAHVVQPVGQLDEHHAHIGDHGQQHFAHVFRLPVFAIGELNFVDFGYALDDVRDLIAEKLGDLFAGGGRVFDGVVQQRGGDGRRVELHLGQHLGHLQRMDDVGIARGALLPLVMRDAKIPGFADQLDVFCRTIGLNQLEERFETLTDRQLGGRGIFALRFFRGRRDSCRDGLERVCFFCRDGLADRRHTPLYGRPEFAA